MSQSYYFIDGHHIVKILTKLVKLLRTFGKMKSLTYDFDLEMKVTMFFFYKFLMFLYDVNYFIKIG